jgi:hypothetical protein
MNQALFVLAVKNNPKSYRRKQDQKSGHGNYFVGDTKFNDLHSKTGSSQVVFLYI